MLKTLSVLICFYVFFMFLCFYVYMFICSWCSIFDLMCHLVLNIDCFSLFFFNRFFNISSVDKSLQCWDRIVFFFFFKFNYCSEKNKWFSVWCLQSVQCFIAWTGGRIWMKFVMWAYFGHTPSDLKNNFFFFFYNSKSVQKKDKN